MTTQRLKVSLGLLLTAAACASLGIVFPRAPARALPPRPPTPTPTPIPARAEPAVRSGLDGGFIELRVRFPTAWPGRGSPWQELWTAVQWQHPDGTWHQVEGWRGTLDEVTADEGGAVVGHKTWWVAGRDLETGPFRWLVYGDQGGRLLVASDPFDLPARGGGRAVVEVTLE
jgi:hypothetical protein